MDKIEKDIDDIDDISETSSIADNEDDDNVEVIQPTTTELDEDEAAITDSDDESDIDEKLSDDDIEEMDDDEVVNINIKDDINDEIIDDELEVLENDEDLDEEYYQKIDTNLRENIILNHHPELKVHNFEEIQSLCKVVRDENGKVVDPLHKTLPFITCYEKTRIIGERAKQINKGAKHFVNIEPEITDGYLIALKEYEEKKIPFIIQRPLPNGKSEFWRFCDLECF